MQKKPLSVLPPELSREEVYRDEFQCVAHYTSNADEVIDELQKTAASTRALLAVPAATAKLNRLSLARLVAGWILGKLSSNRSSR